MGSGRPASPTVAEAREALSRYDWQRAYALATDASAGDDVDPDASEVLAEAAWWTSRIDECIEIRERLYLWYEGADDSVRAGATALELSENHGFRGQPSVARAWLARARRLLDGAADRGLRAGLLLREAEVAHSTGDVAAAAAFGEDALAIGRACRDVDVEAESLQCLARLRIAEGDPEDGLALFDEAMLLCVEGRCSPFVTGKVYCSFISACEELGDLPRAAEWIEVGCRWAEQHPVSAFPGLCRVHRAEVLQMRGEWKRAEEEARRACSELEGVNAYNTALSFREVGEIRRRLGDLEGADAAFRAATDLGLHPQPGLALLRLAENRVAVAARMIQQAMCEVGDDELARAKLLPAAVQIGVASDDLDAARSALADLERITRVYRGPLLEAAEATSRGRLLLAEDDLVGATAALRLGLQRWRALAVPYEVATTQVLLGEAARRASDDDEALACYAAAAATFARLGAALDVARIDDGAGATATARTPAASPTTLTERETQILRLVAAGNTNRAIANEMFVSEKTVERHLSHIFRKLGVSSRAAATAHAVRLGLVDVGAEP